MRWTNLQRNEDFWASGGWPAYDSMEYCMQTSGFGLLESRQRWPLSSLVTWSLQNFSALPKTWVYFKPCSFCLPKHVPHSAQSSTDHATRARSHSCVPCLCAPCEADVALCHVIVEINNGHVSKGLKLANNCFGGTPTTVKLRWSLLKLYTCGSVWTAEDDWNSKGSPCHLPQQKGSRLVKHRKRRKSLLWVLFPRNMCSFSRVKLVPI